MAKYKRTPNSLKNIIHNIIYFDAIDETKRSCEKQKEKDSLAWCIEHLGGAVKIYSSGSNYYGMWIDCFYRGVPLSFKSKRQVAAFLLSLESLKNN